MNFYPILWEEWITWRKRFILYLGMYMLSPLLFLVTFGWGSGSSEYLRFLLPGIMAFSALTNCYTGVSNRILSSNTVTFGYALSGALRGFFAVALILLVGFFLGVKLVLSWSFFLVLFLLCFTFSSLGVAVGFGAQEYEDSHLIADLLILPMSFLGGTFVAINKLPIFLQKLTWLMPLTPGSLLLRSLAEGEGMHWGNLLLLLGWLMVFFALAQLLLGKTRQE